MINSKGFVALPFLIWVVVGILTVTTIKNAYLEGGTHYEQSDLAMYNPTSDTSETPSPTPTPIANPSDLTEPVEQFYSLLSSKKFDGAWILLSKNFQDYAQNYDNFVKGYKSTLSTLVKDMRVQDLANNMVFVQLESSDNVNGQVQTKTFEGTWKLALENGQWKLDSADITLKSVSPTPEPTTVPIPTVTSTPANAPITHDGTRTGAFVQYNEWATGQKIQIYENELLSYTFPNGNQTYMTKGDIAWFEKNSKPNLVNSNSGNNSPSTGGYYPTYTSPSNLNNSYYPTYEGPETPYPTYETPETPSLTFSEEDSRINIYGGASSYTQIGNTVWGSDGSSYTKIGNTVWGTEGTYTKIGNTTWGPNGNSTQIGNTLWGSDGTNYTKIGNTTWGSDGSSYTRIGNTTWGF